MAGRKKTVSWYLKGQSFYVRYQHKGERIKRSLKTKIVRVRDFRIRQIENLILDETYSAEPEVLEIFFQTRPPALPKESRVKILKEFKGVDPHYAVAKMADKIDTLQKENFLLNKELIEVQEKLKNLESSVEAQRVIAANQMPATVEVLELFKKSVEDLFRKGVSQTNFIDDFLDFIDFDHEKSISTITAFQINQYLINDVEGNENKASRWNKSRIKFTKFFNWACSQWPFPNPTATVETKKLTAQKDIIWHSIEDIQSLLVDQDDYWSAMIGLMALAGLSAHEVRGLKTTDIKQDEKGVWKVRVTPNASRSLKSFKRQRNVLIHKIYLLPLIQKYLNSKNESEFLFPARVPSKTEIWTADTFSRHLCGYKGKKSLTVIGALPRLLNGQKCNALSLRRTFGSLLIRSGKTEVEVAAAMGNSPEMVRKHYARILGEEVTIDF